MSDKFKDTDLREALRRKYADTPQLPDGFIDRMRQQQQPTPKRHWGLGVAACLIIMIGIGTTLMVDDRRQETGVRRLESGVRSQETGDRSQAHGTQVKAVLNQPNRKDTVNQGDRSLDTDGEAVDQGPVPMIHQPDANLHYAANVTQEDTTVYQDPARMDEFIAKLAEFNKAKAVPLNCSSAPNDSTIVSTAYVFEDRQKLDLFSRLLQAACWYDSKTPGYMLNFSQQQFFFTLKDLRRGEKFLWIMGRLMDGRILLFSTHSPIEAPVSLTCYQAFLEQLTNTDNIISQF